MYRAFFAVAFFSSTLAAGASEVQPDALHVPPSLRPAFAAASIDGTPANPYATLHGCWEQAADLHRVNPYVLVAIAEVESNRRPTAVNRNHNGTVDIGLMQINSSWLPQLEKFGITSRHLLDPCINVHVGAWILSKNMAQFGETSWRAVGAYNARRDDLRLRYASKVHDRLTRWLPAEPPSAATPTRQPTRR